MPQRVNIRTQVNSAAIRRETLNGREHWVVPSYTLPSGVIMNGGLYPNVEIDAHYKELEGTLAPLGHPMVNGAYVSAFSPEGINVGHVGAWNRNVRKVGNRVYLEKWIDVNVANQSEGGKRLLSRLEDLESGKSSEPIHTSVAAYLDRIEANASQKAAGAEWVAHIDHIDHDAILLDKVGAATPDDGVGMMVNADQATPLIGNEGVLTGESFREREQRLDQAAHAQFGNGQGPDSLNIWVADFTDTQAIIMVGGTARLYGYRIEGGRVVIDGTGEPVEQRTSWIARVPVINQLIQFFTNRQARPDTQKESDMPLTAEEKAELTKDISSAIAKDLSANLAEAIKPITDKVAAIEANQKTLSDTLTATQDREIADKRKAVAEKFGEIVANALSGDALEDAYKRCASAAPIGAGGSGSDKPDFSVVPD